MREKGGREPSHCPWRVIWVTRGDRHRRVGAFLCSRSSFASQMLTNSSPRLSADVWSWTQWRPQSRRSGTAHGPLSPPPSAPLIFPPAVPLQPLDVCHFSGCLVGDSFQEPPTSSWALSSPALPTVSISEGFLPDLTLVLLLRWDPGPYRPSQGTGAGSTFREQLVNTLLLF